MNETTTDCGLCWHLTWLAGKAMDDGKVLVHCDYADVTGLARRNALGRIETPAWCPLRKVAA